MMGIVTVALASNSADKPVSTDLTKYCGYFENRSIEAQTTGNRDPGLFRYFDFEARDTDRLKVIRITADHERLILEAMDGTVVARKKELRSNVDFEVKERELLFHVSKTSGGGGVGHGLPGYSASSLDMSVVIDENGSFCVIEKMKSTVILFYLIPGHDSQSKQTTFKRLTGPKA